MTYVLGYMGPGPSNNNNNKVSYYLSHCLVYPSLDQVSHNALKIG